MNVNLLFRHRQLAQGAFVAGAFLSVVLTGCHSKDQGNGAPPPAQVIHVSDMNVITIDSNDVAKFPLAKAGEIEAAAELKATGTVFPDISREVPVISLANGRVVDIKTRLDDNVKKGQLLFSVQSPDISNAFDAYIKAVNDEQLANKANIRAQDLFEHGAISEAMAEQADDAEKDAKADLAAADEQLKILWRRQESPQQCGQCLCAHHRCDHRTERDQCGSRGRDSIGFSDCLHHCGPELGLDHLRRLRE